ncbi:MAG TPA: AI-2E family transporter [Methylocella sp.]|nr:AI-2E family transporter [Methylocella sp.]
MVSPAKLEKGFASLAGRTALITTVVVCFVAGLLVLWEASSAVLVVLVGLIVSVLFDAGARGIGLLVSWPRHIRLVIVFLLAALLITTIFWWGGTRFSQEVGQFIASMQTLPKKLSDFFASDLHFLPGGPQQYLQLLPNGGTLFGDATTIVTAIADSVLKSLAIIFLGAFFSWEPKIYKAALLSLLPKDSRARVDEVLDKSAHALRQWMVGQSVSMAVIFLVGLAALGAVGMPYPVLLALQAGLLTFIPTLGPFAAGIVIILAGFSVSPMMALYGLCTYLVIQFLESNLVTPMVQRRTVRIPPAIGLGIQLIAWGLFGLIGLAFALPIAAAAKVLIEELYVKDRLGGGWLVD